MIYVDDLKRCPPCDPAGGRWRFKSYCRLWAESTFELNEFAQKIGVKPDYFRNLPPSKNLPNGFPHFDLTANKRRMAIRHGAKPVTSAEMVTLAGIIT